MNVHCSTAFDRVADASGIEILDHGLAELDGEWNHRHIRPSYSRLYYILSGGGFVETERETVSLVSGKTYLIPAGLTLHYGCPGQMTQLYFHVSVRAPDGETGEGDRARAVLAEELVPPPKTTSPR